MISIDSLTVIAMMAVLALGRVACTAARCARRRPPPVALAGSTGLFAALWLAEFASAGAGAVVAIVALVVIAAGLGWMALVRLRGGASTSP